MSYFNINLEVIHNHRSLLDEFANLCLTPHRYLFNGRTIEVWKKSVIDAQRSFSEKSWQRTAAAILLWVPGLILGVLAKLAALTFSPALKSTYQTAGDFDQNPYPLTDALSLELSHARLEKMSAALKKEMTTKNVWSDPDYIGKVSSFMDAASEEIRLIYSLLEQRHDGKADVMAKVMVQQIPSSVDDTIYSFPYFYDSLTEMYHLARSCTFIDTNCYHFPPLEDEDQVPYFDDQNEKHRWRMLYNDFCQKLDDYDLRSRLRDGRFANWSVPDKGIVQTYGYPDTRPTPPPGYFS